MKSLGVKQLQKKKYRFLGFEGVWLEHIGDLMGNFIAIIYGRSGQGKTEYCIRLAKYLCRFGKVAWISYEQRHGADLQKAINRNAMEEVSGKFVIIDPLAGRDEKKSLFTELCEFLGKTSCSFIFIDSLNYIGISQAEYFELKERFGEKKGIIFISHEHSGKPDTRVGVKIEYDGIFSVFVKKFIARHTGKNRVGGKVDYFIWEERARELDPLYFKKLENEQA